MEQRHVRRRRHRYRRRIGFAMLLLVAAAFVGLIVFAVLSERKRVETLAAVVMPPAVIQHNQLAEAIRGVEADGREIPQDLAPAAASVARWAALFQRLEQEVEGPEWDEVTDLWYAAKSWEALSPEDRTTILAFLDARAGLITSLRECAALGGPVRAHTLPVGDGPPSLTAVCALILRIDAVARSNTGNPGLALDNCLAGIQLSEALAAEPSWFAQVARRSRFSSAYQAIQEVFDPGDLSGGDVARLIHAVRASAGREMLVLEIQDFQLGMEDDHADLFDKAWGERFTDMSNLFLLGGGSIAARGALFAYASPLGRPWLNRDIARSSELLSRAIAVAHLPYYEAMARYDATVYGFSPYARIVDTMPIVSMQSQANYEAQRQLLQIGLTLEQYQAEHGTLPVSLDTISAGLSEATNIDPFTGGQLIYQVSDSDFLLYSVGRNQTDDGGKHDFTRGDIVWRGTSPE